MEGQYICGSIWQGSICMHGTMAVWHLARMQSRKCHGRSAAPTVITESIFTRAASKEQEGTFLERIKFISMSIRN